MMYSYGNHMNNWMWLVMVVGLLSAGGLIVAAGLLIKAATTMARISTATHAHDHGADES
jgi:hypothetical protein